jgi:hypothetical protein
MRSTKEQLLGLFPAVVYSVHKLLNNVQGRADITSMLYHPLAWKGRDLWDQIKGTHARQAKAWIKKNKRSIVCENCRE